MVTFNQTYPTDLKYTEWQLISDYFPSNTFGRAQKWERWQIINAIFYVNRTGFQGYHPASRQRYPVVFKGKKVTKSPATSPQLVFAFQFSRFGPLAHLLCDLLLL